MPSSYKTCYTTLSFDEEPRTINHQEQSLQSIHKPKRPLALPSVPNCHIAHHADLKKPFYHTDNKLPIAGTLQIHLSQNSPWISRTSPVAILVIINEGCPKGARNQIVAAGPASSIELVSSGETSNGNVRKTSTASATSIGPSSQFHQLKFRKLNLARIHF